MIQILQHGNNVKSGYSLIEATIAIFIASIALCTILAMVNMSIKMSSKTYDTVIEIIEENNNAAKTFFEKE